jgi:hypothetical protein
MVSVDSATDDVGFWVDGVVSFWSSCAIICDGEDADAALEELHIRVEGKTWDEVT